MSQLYEAEIATGLHDIATQEIESALGVKNVALLPRGDGLQFRYDDFARDLLRLQTVIAVYALLHFDIPRPKAFLGHEHFTRLVTHIRRAMALVSDPFTTLYISAAGSDSSVMLRLKEALAAELGLKVADDEGDLLLRIRRTPQQKSGWDVLIRLGNRPSATRDWRVANMAGALNASVAHAMLRMLNPMTDQLLNIGCGSGTLLIEWSSIAPHSTLIGCDVSPVALQYAHANLEASGSSAHIIACDARRLPFEDACFETLCADLPFGQLVGSHTDNVALYPALMREAARVSRIGAQFVVITQEVRLFEDTIEHTPYWRMKAIQKITLSGLHPRIYILERI